MKKFFLTIVCLIGFAFSSNAQFLPVDGTTNGSGNFTFVFNSPYTLIPYIFGPVCINSNADYKAVVTNIDEEGFTIQVQQPVYVTISGNEVKTDTWTPVTTGVLVNVLIMER